MARRRRGRPVHGWLLIDKPAGIGSTAVVSRVRGAFGARKAGHSGTLDPGATGLLAVALGEATKTIPYIQDARKGYRFTVRWGVATTTDDAEGPPVATSDARPTDAEIEAALAALLEATTARAIIVTRAGKGMSLIQRGGSAKHFPGRAREVFDVSGAGDTVIATLAVMLAHGAGWAEAIHVANVAAGVVVGKLGTAVVTREELAAALN